MLPSRCTGTAASANSTVSRPPPASLSANCRAPLPTRHNSSASAGTGISPTLATRGTRRTRRSGTSTLMRPWPAAARSISGTLERWRAYCRSGGAPTGDASSRPAIAKTTLRPAIACASRVSLLGRPSSLAASSAGKGTRRDTSPGENRSGSGNRISSPVAAGPCCAIFEMSSARSVRGQGHCPCCASAISSISTMVTGALLRSRGARR